MTAALGTLLLLLGVGGTESSWPLANEVGPAFRQVPHERKIQRVRGSDRR